MQWNKKCKTIDVQKKTVYWDLINRNMNKRDVQTGCSGYVHKAAIRVMGIWMFFSNNLVSVYETGFVLRSLMAGGRSSSSFSQFLPSCS